LEPVEVTVTLPLTLPAETGAKVTLKVALWPALSVAGVEIPLTEKPEPLLATFEIVRVEPPVFVTVSDNTCLLPSGTDPKSKLVGFAPSAPGATPVPDNGTDNEGFVAFEVMVTLPLALPAVTGAKVTLKVALCPAVSVAGVEIPLTEKPVPLLATFEMVRVEPPVLVTVSDSTCLLPSETLPKFKLVGFDPSAPCVTPVPDNGRDSEEFGASEVIVTVPLALPDAWGANETVHVVLCEALRVRGVVMPLSLNPVPLTEACEILTATPVSLVSVIV
jgi:hypothetical protein